ncbi:PAS domain S-box-containing protein [Motilibacter rhizosphaerae]|uniref:Sensor-like histidine kinase SenX3 n=1 Tax=Motilibacter rhizosphaerae TaxID=598652 RepID=A0A4Q7NAA8_9ACTN|nr:PAS domain S-box protein [Motilibacter rhizosphaerae]RZS79443.1 PAS domain S-box-containing protein [Motilibacter rhizosphaerae]
MTLLPTAPGASAAAPPAAEPAQPPTGQAEAFLSAVLSDLSDAIVACDAEGRLTLFNSAAVELHGLPAAPLLSDQWTTHYDLRDGTGRRLSMGEVPLFRALRGEVVTAYEMAVGRPDGTTRTVLANGRPLRALDGTPLGAVVSMRDVTEERRAAASAAVSEEQFRTVFDASAAGFLLTEEDGRILRANPALCRMLGRDEASLLGLTSRALTHPDDRQASAIASALALRQRDARPVFQNRFVRADGSAVWTEVSLRAVDGPDGRAYGLAQVEDITLRRQAAEHAERETERLRATVEVQRAVTAQVSDRARMLRLIAEQAALVLPAADGAVVELLQGDVLHYAAATGRLTPFEGMDIPVAGSLAGLALTTGTTARCDDPETDPRVNREACRRVGIGSMLVAPLFEEGHTTGVLKVSSAERGAFTTADAQQLTMLADALSTALRQADDYARIQGLLRERTGALDALHDSESRFRLAFDSSPLGMAITSLADPPRFLQVNAAMSAITGYPADELVGMAVSTLHHEDDRAATASVLQGLRSGEYEGATVDRRYRRSDGSVAWVRIRTAVVRPLDGSAAYLVSQIEDISERRAAAEAIAERTSALEASNRQLERANQLKLDLIGMLGHEINNPLAAILGYTDLAADTWDSLDEDDRRRVLDVVGRQARKLDEVVREVLTLVTADAGRLVARPEAVEVRGLLRGVLDSTPGGEDVALRAPAEAYALVQPQHLAQVVQNLVSNAAKYAEGATELAVVQDGAWVLVEVADRGPGVPEEFRERLFDRFSRADGTAGSVRGTGLGLHIVRELVRANGGDVAYEPRPGGGSTFRVRVPAHAGLA